MIMDTFFIAWFFSTFAQIWLAQQKKQRLGWILPALFLLFAVWACSDLAQVGIRVSVLITIGLPCVWLPSVFYLAYFFWKQKEAQQESEVSIRQKEGEPVARRLDK